MTDPVEFGMAISNSHPSGMGSYTYEGSFSLAVQDLAFDKQVSIWAQVGQQWKDIPASYLQALPDNGELWRAPANNSEGEFVAKYTVNGTTYWDNNGGMNYRFPQAFDEFAVLTGRNFPLVVGPASLASSMLEVFLGVQNLAYSKVVGMVFSTDHGSSWQVAHGHYRWTMKSGLEVWQVSASVGSATQVQLAAFYQVLGREYWDNNFHRNYQVTPGSSPRWGGLT